MPKTKAIKGFGPDNVRALSTEATEVVRKALAKYGITIQYGGGKYSELEFNIKLKLQCESTDGETQAMKDYRRYADSRGLPIEMLGAGIHINGATYQVIGFLPKKRKNNIALIRLSDEQKRICPADYAIHQFNKMKELAESKFRPGTSKGKAKAKKEHPLAKHPFGGECQEGCDPKQGIHVMYNSATARGR